MDRLFDKSFQDYYTELFNELKIKLASEPDNYIITQPTEDLVKYYLNQSLSPIEYDPSKDECKW